MHNKRGEVVDTLVTKRNAWIQALHRDDLTDNKIKNLRICSDHFISGAPSEDPTHPDYVPNVNMGYGSKKKDIRQKLDRHIRQIKRRKRKLYEPIEKSVTPGTDGHQQNCQHVEQQQEESQPEELIVTPEITTVDNDNTELIQTLQNQVSSLIISYEKLKKEITINQRLISIFKLSEEAFQKDDRKTNYYTGVPTYTALKLIFSLVENHITSVASLSKFQQFILCLLHLRLNLAFTDLSYRFNISVQTTSRIFYKVLHVLYITLRHFIIWPEREDLIATMPESFKQNFGNKVTVIIDCFEVKTEKSSNLLAQAATWSAYKHHNTIKILIGICPQGAITFISKAYGGRNSDKHITEDCGILEKLLPNDLVLADRGFLIRQSVEMRAAKVITPAFLKGRKQLSSVELHKTRKLANVRIHVERVIGQVRKKYRILFNLLPVHKLKKKNLDLNIPVIDEILTVTCALTNLCPSVVPNPGYDK